MTTRTFAPWVEPIAEEFHSARGEVLQFARSAPAELWARQSPDEGWTCKDIMSRLAAGTGKQHQALLRAVIGNTRVDPNLFGNAEVINERDAGERRARPIDAIIDEYEADTEELLDLLSQLTKEGQGRRQKGFDQSFGEALPIFGRHELEHLAQLRAADEGAR